MSTDTAAPAPARAASPDAACDGSHTGVLALVRIAADRAIRAGVKPEEVYDVFSVASLDAQSRVQRDTARAAILEALDAGPLTATAAVVALADRIIDTAADLNRRGLLPPA